MAGWDAEWVHQGFAPTVLRNTQLCKFYFAKEGNRCRRPNTCTFSHAVADLDVPQAPLAKARTDYPRMYFCGPSGAISTTGLLREVVLNRLEPAAPPEFEHLVKMTPEEPPPVLPDTPWTYLPHRGVTPPRTRGSSPLRSPARSPRRAAKGASPRRASPARPAASSSASSSNAAAKATSASSRSSSSTAQATAASSSSPAAKSKSGMPAPPTAPRPQSEIPVILPPPDALRPETAPSVFTVYGQDDNAEEEC